MQKQLSKITSIIILALCSIETSLARAGGGSGGGGGYGSGGSFGGGYRYGRRGGLKWQEGDGIRLAIILIVIACIVALSWYGYKILIRYKAARAAGILKKSALLDPIWKKESIEDFTKKTFLQIQKAWMAQDMHLVTDLVTENLYDNYQRILDNQQRVGIYNHLADIRIEKIEIVGVEDYIDDDEDNFTAYISGHMVDLIVRSPKTDFQSKELTYFEDLYYFIRYKNTWLLSGINNEVDIWSVGELNLRIQT